MNNKDKKQEKTAFDIVEDIFEKIADFRSGNFSGEADNQAGKGFKSGNFSQQKDQPTTKGFRSGGFTKATPEEKEEEVDTVVGTKKPKTAKPTSQFSIALEEARNEMHEQRMNAAKALTIAQGGKWYNSLPQSLKDDMDEELNNEAMRLMRHGVDPSVAGLMLSSNIKSTVDDNILNKYKYIDQINSKITDSDIYSDTYDKGTARKSGPKWGAGIGALAGTGIGALAGKGKGALIGAGIGTGLGALTGRMSGVSMDKDEAFGTAQKQLAPNYHNDRGNARKELMKRMG